MTHDLNRYRLVNNLTIVSTSDGVMNNIDDVKKYPKIGKS